MATNHRQDTAPGPEHFTIGDQEFPIGSVSTGTIRREDLGPIFAGLLRRLAVAAGMRDSVLESLGRLEAEIAGNDWSYLSPEDLDWMQDEINEMLWDVDVYFGSHPDDGYNFGFWFEDTY